ncbi:MAG: hypothetical protein EBV06_03145 [Planctomycetia bacterium]|nr:hypothetical protein [Planctomycetia bacterium]
MRGARWIMNASLLGCLTLVIGCTDYDGRVEVTGTVKLKGQPLKEGFISFSPLENQNTQAQVLIASGSYRMEQKHGLRPGKYLIRVSAGDGKTPYLTDGPPGPGGTNIISKEIVPADWNINSKQERTVNNQSPNKIDFDIP